MKKIVLMALAVSPWTAGSISPCARLRSRTGGKSYSCTLLVLESSEVGEKESGLAKWRALIAFGYSTNLML